MTKLLSGVRQKFKRCVKPVMSVETVQTARKVKKNRPSRYFTRGNTSMAVGRIQVRMKICPMRSEPSSRYNPTLIHAIGPTVQTSRSSVFFFGKRNSLNIVNRISVWRMLHGAPRSRHRLLTVFCLPPANSAATRRATHWRYGAGFQVACPYQRSHRIYRTS